MTGLTAATKLAPSRESLAALKLAGRRAAEAFLSQKAANIGHQPSVTLREIYR